MITEKSKTTTITNEEDTLSKKDNIKSSPQQIHNNFTKKWLSNKDNILSFIKTYLPDKITKQITIDDIDLIAESFVDNCFREKISDIVVKIKHGKKNIYVYSIIEMKSVADKLTAAQLMSYVLKAMLEYKDMRKKKPLPMIYPLILYHGDTKFKYVLDFLDLVDGSKEEIDKYLRGNLQLIDLNTTTDEELMDKSEVLMSLPLLCLKHIKDKNMLDFLTRNKKHAKRLLSLFRQYIETVGMENMTSILHYVYTAGKIDNEDEFVQFLNNIKPKLEKNMMTLREAAVQEGREEGIELGRNRMIQEMLARHTPEMVANILNLPIKRIKQLAANLTETA